MFFKLLRTRLRGNSRANTPRLRSTVAPRLEELESRLTPSLVTVATVTNASVQIIPNLSTFTATEKVTATVTAASSVPPGIPVPSGAVSFNLNNQQQQANLDATGHATATFTLPLLALFTSEELTVKYPGASIASPTAVSYASSTFNAPLYLNFDNLVFAATVSFNPLSAQQMSGAVYNTAQGETDDFGLFSYQYVDPGLIASVRAFGQDFPGFFAFALGAYGPEFMNNGGSKS